MKTQTKTEKKIIAMLKENTGANILDSGGAYGRHYEHNQSRDFKSEPEVTHENGENIQINIFHYLNAFLELNKKTDALNKKFKIHCGKDDNPYLSNMESFPKTIGAVSHGATNTYNYENLLSQVLQYVIFSHDGEDYIILQIHGGCDVRGGYTVPYIFAVGALDNFYLAQCDLNISTDKSSYWSDDCGNRWYNDDGKTIEISEIQKEGIKDLSVCLNW